MRLSLSSLAHPTKLLRRLGQALAVVTQLVVLVAPLAEAHVDREMRAHAEAPRSAPHPGQHDQKSCPACVLFSMHGRAESRAEVPSIVQCVTCAAPDVVVGIAAAHHRVSNSSRAPPVSL